MVLPRTSALGRMFRSSASPTARIRSVGQVWRTAGRRTYASDHGPAKKSSDLPWMIGSVVVTVPSAAWLLQQGPTKGDHGHGHEGHGKHEEHEESGTEPKDEGGEEGKDEGEEKPKDDAEAKTEDGDKDDSAKNEDSSDSESDGDKETPATSDDDDASADQDKKGKGEKQEGETRPRTETKEEKMGEGVVETASIHGSVDTGRKARGTGEGDVHEDVVDKKPKDRSYAVQS